MTDDQTVTDDATESSADASTDQTSAPADTGAATGADDNSAADTAEAGPTLKVHILAEQQSQGDRYYLASDSYPVLPEQWAHDLLDSGAAESVANASA